jgi:translation elongation factor EF-1alpha
MKAGQKIIVMPSGALGEIKSIETHHTEMPSAEAGDNIGFNLLVLQTLHQMLQKSSKHKLLLFTIQQQLLLVTLQ